MMTDQSVFVDSSGTAAESQCVDAPRERDLTSGPGVVKGKAEKRLAIMRAAERLFHNRRFHEVTLDEVAEAAGVGKGTIYRYFNDKDDLFFQVATTGFEDLCQRVEACATTPDPLRHRLLCIVRAMCDYFDERIEMFAIIHAESAWMPEGEGSVRERWQELRTRLPKIVRRVFEDGMKSGEIRREQPAEIIAYYFLGMVRILVRDLSREHPMPDHQERIVDIFLLGATPRPASNEA